MARERISNVTVSTFKRILHAAYRASVPVLAIGHKGIGKSEIVKQFCHDKKLDFIDIRLAYLEAQDIVGFPYRDPETGVMHFARPDWLPTAGHGILFLDEINRARIDVLQAVFQLVRDRSIGGILKSGDPYYLPEGWTIVSAMNPDSDDDRYFVSPIDESLYDRFLRVGVTYSAEEFRRYVMDNKSFNDTLRSFMADRDILLDDEEPEVWIDPSPRSFEMFNAVYRILGDDEEDLILPVGEGLLGPANTQNFINYRGGFYSEIRELLDAILTDGAMASQVHEKILHYRDSRQDVIIALRDHFLISYADCISELSPQKIDNLLKTLFLLRDEQVVAWLVAFKERLGGKYLSIILKSILENEATAERYKELIENNPLKEISERL